MDAWGGTLGRITTTTTENQRERGQGILVIKDFTSIVSGDRKARQQILAALREIHDGKWNRRVGADGGQKISWEGRIICICACTTARDSAYAVTAQMGPRFVIIRSSSRVGRLAVGLRAIRNAGKESTIREQISQAVAALIADAKLDNTELKKGEQDDLVAAADIVTLARTGVEIDYQGNVIDSHEPEMPTRFAKQLALIFCGALAIGMDRKPALALRLRCARDSIPPIRLAVLEDLRDHDVDDCRAINIAKRLRKPWSTIRRTLEALYVLEMVERIETDDDEIGEDDGKADNGKADNGKADNGKADNGKADNGKADNGKKTDRKAMRYALAVDVNLAALD
jgi:DNA-binding transcriptional ArsR family regulator